MWLVRGLVLSVCVVGSQAAAVEPVPPPPAPSPPRAQAIAPAAASSPPASPAPEAPPRVRIVSLTATPFALPWEILDIRRHMFPIPSVSLELRAHARVGIAVMALAGDNTYTPSEFTDHATMFEIGAEPRYYFRGGFRGAMLGAALHYYRMHVDATYTLDPSFVLPFDFAGYSYGAFAGYKLTMRKGFTVEAKGGLMGISRTMTDGGPYADVVPITDVRIGWSF